MLAWACGGGSSNTTSPSPTVTTSVTPTRIIGVSGNLAFGNVQVGGATTATMTVSNSGNSALTVSGMSVSTSVSSVLLASWTQGTIPAGNSQVVTIQFSPTAAQTYSGVLLVNGDQTS